MERNNPETATRSERPPAALTPRPIRLLLIGHVRPGQEATVREVQARFPIEAAAEAGIDAIEAYIGSGYYALMLETSVDDVQQSLSACLTDERTKAFFAGLEPDVEGLPGPEWHRISGDSFHAGGPEARTGEGAEAAFGTAALPLAANMYRWRIGQQPEIGKEPHGREG